MKKILLSVFCIILAFSFVGCEDILYSYELTDYEEQGTPPSASSSENTEYQESTSKPQVLYYDLMNAEAIPNSDGTYRFVQVCPFCGLETPTSANGITHNVKCRKSNCEGREIGYSYRVKPVYN